MMKLLLLTFYYPPDLCAGSFRAGPLIKSLSTLLSKESSIDVLTTIPNRYKTHIQSAPEFEENGNIKIHRFQIPTHSSGMLDQSKAFLAYARKAMAFTRKGEWDLVIGTSSRLMTAALATFISRRKKIPVYLDIRDIFTDTMSDVLKASPLRITLPIFRAIERYTIKNASRINIVSDGFRPYFNRIAPGKNSSLFMNGIDEEFLENKYLTNLDSPVLNELAKYKDKRKIVLYAGNIGEGQGLHKILPNAAAILEKDYVFIVVGDGGRRRELEQKLEENKITNVKLMDPVNRQTLIAMYQEADILFLHLNDYPAFEKVLPSKIFEYAATKKPILAGVHGYSERFISNEIPGTSVFFPCDVEGMLQSLHKLEAFQGEIDSRGQFIRENQRKHIMDKMALDILDVLNEPS
jgi:glycosyltransferase involved in cell wall biosynthesis